MHCLRDLATLHTIIALTSLVLPNTLCLPRSPSTRLDVNVSIAILGAPTYDPAQASLLNLPHPSCLDGRIFTFVVSV
ncbi:hypothetical protein NMY22_g18146 [Coprinellus aureogranulatus]|nr:hypothetical protein NMY22_g18146 [Coprinellus aureogranulatus]